MFDLKAKNVKINNSGFGFVSKDGSVIEGSNIRILNSKKADIAAYRKKYFYDGGKINVKNIFVYNKKIFIQNDSIALINNRKIKTTKFNSKKKFYYPKGDQQKSVYGYTFLYRDHPLNNARLTKYRF